MFDIIGVYYDVEDYMICQVNNDKWVILNMNGDNIIDVDFQCEEDAYWLLLESGLINDDSEIFRSDEKDVA